MRSTTRRTVRSRVGAAAALAAAALFSSVSAAPWRPARDDLVLERLTPAVVALRALHARRGTGGLPLDAALAAAQRYVEAGRLMADPRTYGYAQAALGSWWSAEPAPAALRVMRARILQFRHEFDAAVRELASALSAEPFAADAWLLLASIEQVRGNAAAARAACLKLIPIADPLVGATCAAGVSGLQGRARDGAQLLASALARPTSTTPSERAWSLTTLAELRLRGGDDAGAETALREALRLSPQDVYAKAAYADLLLDADRAREVRALLGSDAGQPDATLLRAAIAAQRNGDADAAALGQALSQRFAEARARGDRTHLREQARCALELEHDARTALALAQENFAVQREPADARVLLEAASAAGDVAAAQPALDWARAAAAADPSFARLAARIGQRQ